MGACKHACTLFIMGTFNPINKIQSPGDVEQDMQQDWLQDDFGFGNNVINNIGNWLTAQWNNFRGTTAQQTLQSNQQEFDEYMYQNYNSPQALKEQFREAGLNTNLLGSTSFGTAQSAAGAPAVNGDGNPVASIAGAVKDLANAESFRADPKVKAAQADYYSSFPDLNSALSIKYGSESALNQQEYDFLQETWNWHLMSEEFNAKNAQQTFYNAVQLYNNMQQQFENMVKEGKVLDEEKERVHWDAQTKKEVYDFLVEHGYYPDANYLDRFYIDYVENGNYSGFARFLRAYRMYEDEANKSAVSSGAIGGKVKIGPVELDTTTIEYGISKGKKVWEMVKEAEESNSSDNSSDITVSTVGDEVNQKELDSAYSIVQSYINGSPYYSERGYVPESFDTSKITDILLENGYDKKSAQRIARMLWLKMNKK